MSQIILKRTSHSHSYNQEFFVIRNAWLDIVHSNNTFIPFGEWLQACGVREEHIGEIGGISSNEYCVTKIIFESEQHYLAFKLKYL